MARLALSLAGGILGTFIPGVGNALGWSIGSAIGGIVGQLAFPGKGQHVYGPRVNDMQVSSSAPGQTMPLLFGSMRLGGNIIWSTGLQEQTSTQKQSAKGGPSVTQTTYTYSVSFAAAFCQGEAQVTRVWGDSKLIYNNGGVIPGLDRGTWNNATTYNVGDMVQFDGFLGAGKGRYVATVQNTNQMPINTNYWKPVTSDQAVTISKYPLPTLYTGSDTQGQDPLMVAHDGATVTPAYRGTCYAVWEDFPLADFGNRLPNIRAEVTSEGEPDFPMTRVGWPASNDGAKRPHHSVTDPSGMTYFMYYGIGQITPTLDYIARYDLQTNTMVANGTLDPTVLPGWNPVTDYVGGADGKMVVDADGYLWGSGILGGHIGIYKFDPWTFKALSFFDASGITGSFPVMQVFVGQDGTSYLHCLSDRSTKYSLTAGRFVAFIVNAKTNTMIGRFDDFTGTLFDGGDTVFQNMRQTIPVIDNQGNMYCIYGGLHSHGTTEPGDWYIVKLVVSAGVSIFVLPGPVYSTNLFSYPPDSEVGVGRAMFWNPLENNLVVMTNGGAYLKIDPNTGSVLDTLGGNSNRQFRVNVGTGFVKNIIEGCSGSLAYEEGDGGLGCTTQWGFKCRVQNGIIWAPNFDNATVLAVSAHDFSVLRTYDFSDWPNKPESSDSNWFGASQGQGAWMFDPIGNSLLSVGSSHAATGYPTEFPFAYAMYRAYLDRLSTNGLTADQIVRKICNLSGIVDGNIDVTLISDIHVSGYPITSLTSGKDMINTLGQAYFFEGRESDFKMVFVPRGQAAALTLEETDLGLIADNAELNETIGQEQDVPKNVEVDFINPDQDYQQGQQKRIRHSATTKTINQTSISLPLVMTTQQAAQLADKIMWSAENERRGYKTNLWKALFMLLDPCDVINFAYHGLQLTGRITDNLIGQNYASALTMSNEDNNTYLSIATGTSGSGFNGQTIKGLVQSLLWILDIPYLQDTDADAAGNIGYYFVMAPATAGGSWPAGVLYSSGDNAAFNQIDATVIAASYGVAQNVLPAPVNGVFAWDNVSTLTLRMANGSEPVSDTQINVLNGTNAAIMYPSLEVIQFTTVTDNGDGTITLSGLLRGRRGTDDFISNHAFGEIVIFPLEGGLVHEQVSLSLLNLARYYRAITVGADINSNPVSQSVALQGRDLMPYAPACFANAPSGGDIQFTWFRRTRIGGAWLDGTGQVPLSEADESYDLLIYNGAGVLKRTFADITPPGGVPDSWTSPAQPHQLYTAAQQSTDGYTTGSGWYAVVYQLSGNVGRGFPATVALP